MDPIFCNGSLWPNSSGVVGSLAAWYDSSNTSSMLDGSGNPITAGGKVATWKDISGNSPAGERDLPQGTDANRPIYLPWSGSNYGWLNGVAGNYFSTPDSVAAGITGDLDLVASIQLDDYTSTSDQIIIAKYTSAGNQRGYYLSVLTSGSLRLGQSTSGGDLVSFNSTAAVTTVVSNGARIWIRAFLDVDNGAAGRTVKFYTSTDGSTWTQLGSDVVVATATNTFDCSAVLEVGSFVSGTSGVATGSIYRAQVWSGNSTSGGTLAADFNPSFYTSGPTFTAATGEVWTVNNGAHIVTRTGLYFDGSNDYLKSAAFSLSQPESVYLVGSQVTWTGGDLLLDGNSSSERLVVYQYTAGGSPQLALTNNAGINGELALKTSGVLCAVFNGAASSLRINRTVAVTGNALTASANGVTLGTNAIASAPSNIFVSELAIYSAAHSTTTQSRLALGFSRKWRFVV